jgi:hypothetical protein
MSSTQEIFAYSILNNLHKHQTPALWERKLLIGATAHRVTAASKNWLLTQCKAESRYGEKYLTWCLDRYPFLNVILCRKMRDSYTRLCVGANYQFVTFKWNGDLGPNNIIVRRKMYILSFCSTDRHKIRNFILKKLPIMTSFLQK